MYGIAPYSQLPYADARIGTVNYSVAVADGAVGHSSLVALLTAMLTSGVLAHTPLAASAGLHNAISDAGRAATTMNVHFAVPLTSGANATTTTAFTVNQIAQIIDTLLATGACTSMLAAKNAVVEAVFAADRLTRDWPSSVSDAAALHDTMQQSLVTAVLLVDDALAQTTMTGHANIVIAVSDAAAVTDPLTHILAAHESVQDGVVAVLSFVLDGDTYTGVVLNTETMGASEYTQFPFNSFAAFAGTYVGAASDGLYVLQGADDAGAPIQSYIRTGLIRVAEGKRARIPEAFFGYTSSGDLVMKVVTTQVDGTKREDWYKLEKRVGGASHSTRVKIGRGLSSVYWQFELHSISGSTFGLDTVELLPMALDRRI